MTLPTESETEFSTLERCFRDLIWCSIDARRSSEDGSEFILAAKKVCDRMNRAHPDRWEKICVRLVNHLELWGGDEEEKLMRPRVINRHHYRNDEGKADPKLLPLPYLYIGRGTPLGNPFTVKDHGDKAYSLYRVHLWEKIKERDRLVMQALATIKWDTHLVCSCAPRPCHGDLVLMAWVWLQRQAWWDSKLFL